MFTEHLLCLSQYLCHVYPVSWLPSAEIQNVQCLPIFPSPKCILVSFCFCKCWEQEPVEVDLFLQLSCMWDDIRWLRQNMAVSVSSSSALQARQKMLSAAAQLQVGPMVYFWLLAQPLSHLQGTELPAVPRTVLEQHSHLQWNEALPARKEGVTLKVKSRNNKGKKQKQESTKETDKETNRYEPVNNDQAEKPVSLQIGNSKL